MWYFYGLALLAGVASAVEPGQNATLSDALGRPLVAALICFLVSTLVFGAAAVLVLTGHVGLPDIERVAAAPWWSWGAGLTAAVLVFAQLIASKRIGAAPFLGLLVTAGVITSILLDHFGLVGFEVHRAGLGRILGGLLMIGGVALVATS